MSEWISVKDHLPDWYKYVHVSCPSMTLPMVSRRVERGTQDEAWYWDWAMYVGLIDVTVTHWMHLPEPPK